MPRQRGSVTLVHRFPHVADRHALVINHRLAFWDWVNDSNEHSLAVRPKGIEGRVYLVVTKGDTERWLEKNWLRVFEQELVIWCRDFTKWPERTRIRFDEWFVVQVCMVVFDTGTKGLKKQHYPPAVVGPSVIEHAKRKRPVIDMV